MEILNKALWSLAISLIIINSIYFSIKLKFPQVRLISLIKAIRDSKKDEEISPKDTLIMSLSSKIGVGSLSGTALCIYYGGVGTILWIFISTFFLSIISYIENVLSILYKEPIKDTSGPQYYIKNKVLSVIYATLILISYIFLFISIQNNTITTLTYNIYNIDKIIVSLIITITSSMIIVGGIKQISKICNKIFPIMMTIFVIIGITVLIKNITSIPSIINLIIKEAFNKESLNGGIIYTIIIALQRTIFANESGVGTSAIISGSTKSKDYNLQGKIGIIQTYFINFIVLGITSLIIVTSNIKINSINNGIELTKEAFFYHFGSFGELLLLIIIVLFSFSTIITVYYYGETSLKYLTNKNIYKQILKIVTIITIFIGGIIKATYIWNLIDIFIALLTIINMYAIYKQKDVIISKIAKK